ncbi:MAG: hypothetical protein R3244_09020, partial [Thermoanaerobaculia bacterium]|nr:hypothetical protein [Thermoanaerobaculia bacterium]
SHCEEVALEPDLAGSVLECLAAGDDPVRALAFVEAMPAQLRRTSKVRKTERQLARRVEALERAARLAAEEDVEPSDEATPSATTPTEPPIEGPREAYPESGAEESSAEESSAAEACAGFRRAALSRRCAEALASLELCRAAAEEPEVAERIAKCLADADRWADVAQFVAELPPQVGGRPKLRKLGRRAAERTPAPAGDPAPLEDPTPPETPGDDEGIPNPDDEPAAGESPPSSAERTTSESAATRPPTEPDAGTLEAVRRRLAEARTAEALDAAVRAAFQLAGRFPQSAAVHLVAAEAAYRAALWEQAVRFFELAGDIADDRPLLLFYRAVSLYEVGRARAALPYLERSLPKLRKTPFVEAYADMIRRAARD